MADSPSCSHGWLPDRQQTGPTGWQGTTLNLMSSGQIRLTGARRPAQSRLHPERKASSPRGVGARNGVTRRH